ncbi:MAG: efflux RND transporter periplasmic adaptor subunit [Proteobacteria bacterium]|nr:efflux RND transporter periplasmic adaptor subunit [Pseudomonadota bacterium]
MRVGRLPQPAGSAIALVLIALAFWLGHNLGASGIGDKEQSQALTAKDEQAAPATVWTCSMHPQIRMDASGSCPICGMDLIPATAAADETEQGAATGKRVQLGARAQALARIRTTTVTRTQPRAEIRLLGHVDYDETRLRTVVPWTAGRIERLHVRVTGERIGKDRVVATLYSPEIYAGMRELVSALRQVEQLASGMHGSAGRARAALEAARERLKLLGVSETRIARVARTRKAPKNVDVRTQFSGTVIKRLVDEGQYVSAGTPLYHVADLSRVWIQIDAFESDLPQLAVGQNVVVKVEGRPKEPFAGKIAFIDPVLDMRKRTARVRVAVSNRKGRLRPGMFAEAVVQADLGKRLAQLVIPDSAALFTGRRSVVYVEVPNASRPTYEMRVVRLGPRSGPVYPVLEGLSEGERVVSNGAFVLDADLQLAGGQSMMTLADDRSRTPERELEVPSAFRNALKPVVLSYLDAQRQLASDGMDAARGALRKLARATNRVEPLGSRAARDAWQVVADKLVGHAQQGARGKQPGDVRSAFEGTSKQIRELLRRFGNPTAATLRLAFCPMAFDAKGAEWIQNDEPLANPYYGAAMLRCGEFRASVAAGELLAGLSEAAPPAPPPAGAGTAHRH